ELAADLRLLDEPADQLGLVAVLLQQDLDGQVAAQVGVAALEHGAHAAAGDLAVDLVAGGPAGGRVRDGPDDGRLGPGVVVAEQARRSRPDRGRERPQDAAPARRGEAGRAARTAVAGGTGRGGAVQPQADQAAGALAAGALGAAGGAAVGSGHRRTS